jgi:hypothetical protein
VWDMKQRVKVCSLKDSNAWVNSVCAVGNKLLSAGGDCLLKVWGVPNSIEPEVPKWREPVPYRNLSGWLHFSKRGGSLLPFWEKVWVVIKEGELCAQCILGDKLTGILYVFDSMKSSVAREKIILDEKWSLKPSAALLLSTRMHVFEMSHKDRYRYIHCTSLIVLRPQAFMFAAADERERLLWIDCINFCIFITHHLEQVLIATM